MATSGEGFAFIKPNDINIEKFLGRGGFGGVSLATHTQWGDVAVKEFDNFTVNQEVLKEARKMWRVISCPYVVNIMGIIDDPGNPLSIVMEYLEFGDLRDFNRKYMMGCNCWARKMRMIQEISLGMNYLHTQTPPIIHRDLKLENVFVGNGFTAKIGDLGLAMSTTSIQAISKPGLAGTFTHIPSEAWTNPNQEPDKFWDIFTFGVTLFELVSGQDPWLGHADATLVSIWVPQGLRPDTTKISSDIPTEITALMQRCWDGTPSNRPQFQEIQKLTTDIYRDKYKADLRKADQAINGRIDAESHDLSVDVTQLSTTDSGFDIVDGDLRTMTIRDTNKESTTTDFGIGIPTTSQPTVEHNMREWHLVKEFDNEGEDEREFRSVRDVAVCRNGDIAVVEYDHEKVYLFNKDGKYKSLLISQATNPTEKLLCPSRVAVTSLGYLVVTDVSKYVKVFRSGSILHSVCTLTPHEDPKTEVNTCGLAVTNMGDIVVGDLQRDLVTIHTQADVWVPKKIKVPIKPVYLATNSQRQIWVSDRWERKVIAMSIDGEILFTMDEFRVGGKNAEPSGMVCDSNGDIYIAVREVNVKTGKAITGTGHIHQYDNRGVFLRCIVKGLYHPYGIAMFNGSLYVANAKSVTIFSTQ